MGPEAFPLEPTTVQLPLGDDPPTARLYYGVPVLEGLQRLPDSSVHMACTSPPYWRLRDYGVPPQQWPEFKYSPMPGLPSVVVPAQEVALGLEPDPLHFIGHLVLVFRELRRVLRPEGTLWVNLGDSYTGGGGSSGHLEDTRNLGRPTSPYGSVPTGGRVAPGLKAKDLTGIPWRFALAMQADGWWLRNDVIWAKASCMPEQVTDRCTRSHEYVFLFAKSLRYFFDNDAIREPQSPATKARYEAGFKDRYGGMEQNLPHGSRGPTGGQEGMKFNPAGRNKRTVWNVNPRPYPGAHFAVWPPELVEPMVKAGTSDHGACPTCAAPWKRRVEQKPTCECEDNDASGRPVVLDPFSGSATTGMIALNLGRDYVGIDLNGDYVKLAEARIRGLKPPGGSGAIEEGSIFDYFG